MDEKMDRDLRLEQAIAAHQDWLIQRARAERARARMVTALHEANVSGFSLQELADMIGLSRQRIGQFLEGTRS
jgi:transcriptional regulator with XRE-family HTH domain